MIFRDLLVKQYENDTARLLNLWSGEEALADSAAQGLLKSASHKSSRGECSPEELDLLATLDDGIGIVATDGVGELVVRGGELDNLDVYLTNTCNLTCKHCCFFGDGRHEQKAAIDFGLLKRAITQAVGMGLCKLKLSGGEPLAYHRMKELLEFVRGLHVRTTVMTNGLLLHRFLRGANDRTLSFTVSLDGFRESHDFLRGEGTHDRTLRNIEKAVSAGFDVEVNMVVYDRNIGDVDRFSAFVRSIGASRLNIQTIRPVGVAQRQLRDNMVKDESFIRRIHQNELDWQAKKIENGTSFCTSCKSGMVIDFNADVFGCTFITEEPTGNLNEASLSELYARGLRENPLFTLEASKECSECELFNKTCAGGCRARAKKLAGSLDRCDHWIPFLLNHPKFHEGGRQAHEFLLI